METEKGDAWNWKAETKDAAERARKVAAAANLLPGIVPVGCGVCVCECVRVRIELKKLIRHSVEGLVSHAAI